MRISDWSSDVCSSDLMKRVLNTAMGTPGHIDYRALKCADSDDLQTCRQAVLTALDEALSDLGGLSNQANWDGTVLTNAKGDATAKLEAYDPAVRSAESRGGKEGAGTWRFR